MTLQAINAQALRPAVNFKAQEAEAPVAAIKTADDSSAKAKHTTAKVLGGTAALAVLGFGIYKLAKGKGAKGIKDALTQSPLMNNAKKSFEETREMILSVKDFKLRKGTNNIYEAATQDGGKLVKEVKFTNPNKPSVVKKFDKAGKLEFEYSTDFINGNATERKFTSYIKDGVATDKAQMSYSHVSNQYGNTQITKDADGLTEMFFLNEKGDAAIGKLAYKDNKITEMSQNINARFDENNKLTYEIIG